MSVKLFAMTMAAVVGGWFASKACRALIGSPAVASSHELREPAIKPSPASDVLPLAEETDQRETGASSDPLIVLDWLAGATSDDMPGILERIEELEERLRSRYLRIAFARWLALDREGATRFVEAIDEIRSARRITFYEVWAEMDAAAAFAHCETIAEPDVRAQINDRILKTLAVADPHAFLRYLDRTPDVDVDGRYITSAFTTLADEEVPRALTLAESFSGMERRWALDGVILAWARKSPREAFDYCLKIEDESLRKAVIRSPVYTMARLDPMAALAERDSLEHPERHLVRATTEQMLRRGDPAEVLAQLEKHMTPAELEQSLNWTFRDAEAALTSSVLNSMTDLEMRDRLARQWISRNVAASAREKAAWIAGNPVEKQAELARVFAESQRSADAQTLTDMAGDYAEFSSVAQALGERAAAMEFLETGDYRGIGEWVEERPADEREFWISMAADHSIRETPEEGAALMAGLLDDHEVDATRSVKRFAEFWAGFEPQSAADWAHSMVPEASRPAMLEAVIRKWTESDLTATSDWLGRLEPGPLRDQVVGAFVLVSTFAEPDAAFVWASTIADHELREALLQSSVEKWKEAGRSQEHQALLLEAELTAEERARFLRQLRANP